MFNLKPLLLSVVSLTHGVRIKLNSVSSHSKMNQQWQSKKMVMKLSPKDSLFMCYWPYIIAEMK